MCAHENNYKAEMAAVIDAMEAEDAGGRLVFVIDATSPIRALLKYRKVHHRRRVDYYAEEELDTLMQLMERHEVVVFIWQTSHVGSPPNEWADVLADEAATGWVRSISGRSLFTLRACWWRDGGGGGR